MGIWRSLPKFKIRKKKLRRDARKSNYPIHLVIGKKDELISWKRLSGWVMKWPPKQRHVLKEGHDLMAAAAGLLLESEGENG